MRVEAGFVNHPKFLRLKKAVGDYAMEAVMRVWGHCEFGQKGEFWKGADAEFVELVACWFGDKGKLYTALVDAKLIKVETKGIRVNDWNHHNNRTVSNWELGRRPKRNQSQSTDKPRPNQDRANHKPEPSHMYVSKDVCMDGTENNKEAGSGQEEKPSAAAVAASRTQFAALTQAIKELEAFGEELNLKERMELSKKRAALAELQKKQAAGKFE